MAKAQIRVKNNHPKGVGMQFTKKTDLSLLDYSEAENGKEFDYPEV